MAADGPVVSGRGVPRTSALARAPRWTFDAMTSAEARDVLHARPDPVSTVRRHGQEPSRVLCFGGGALRGLGLDDHGDGLPGRIADELVLQTGRGAQVDVVVEPDPTAPSAIALLLGLRLRRYDAVVVLLDDPAGQHPSPERWRGALVGLVQLLQRETSGATGLFLYETARPLSIVGPTAGGRDARRSRFLGVTEEICRLSRRVRFAELAITPGGRIGPSRIPDATFEDWGETIVRRMRPVLEALPQADPAVSPRWFRNSQEDERFRQRAVDALRLRRGDRDPLLDRELAEVRSMYRTSKALLTILDGDLQWSKASTDDLIEVPRSTAFCDFAARTDELTLINDTWLDPRTRSNPRSYGAGGVRFYAGFPVHSFDGYRIGMVCILGEHPRSFRPRELEGLRTAAGRIEQLLWNGFLHGGR